MARRGSGRNRKFWSLKMSEANDDVIVFECDCGSNTFVTYEARIMGYTVKYPEGLDIRKMPEHMVEIH